MPDNGGYKQRSDLEFRMTQMEINHATISTRFESLTKATEENTQAIKGMTKSIGDVLTTISYNKGAVWMAIKSATVGTVVVGAFFAVATWVYDAMHGVR